MHKTIKYKNLTKNYYVSNFQLIKIIKRMCYLKLSGILQTGIGSILCWLAIFKRV